MTGGGLMELVAYGAQDVYLTGNPQITHFKVVYRRHTNFSMESIAISMNGAGFGKQTTEEITRNGDLIHEMYMMVRLGGVQLSPNSKMGWVRKIGHALIKSVELQIGGSKIDRQYGTWLDVWWNLARKAGDGERGYNKMIGDVEELTAYNDTDKPEYLLYIPLQFWFNRHVGLSLPLIALQYHQVRVAVEFERKDRLVVYNESFRNSEDYKNLEIIDTQLLVNYIYLDAEERRRFAQVGHEYLIEQVQFTGVESVRNLNDTYTLNFNHPSKEFIWAMKNGNYTTGKRFLYYTGGEWNETALREAAMKLLKESMCLLDAEITEVDPYGGADNIIQAGEEPPTGDHWEAFEPEVTGVTANGKINVTNNSQDKTLWINTNSLLRTDCPGGYSLTDKIFGNVVVNEDNLVYCTGVSSTLTVRDLSLPIDTMCDTRCYNDDPHVNQFDNYGILIDGSGNPVSKAIIQLNGHERFSEREGAYFNYVQPYQHHTNTPKDGINCYSMALNPEEHQPSGSSNQSRIDTSILKIVFADSTKLANLPELNFLNADNTLYIYDHSYNVLRVMSGMGGLAYSN